MKEKVSFLLLLLLSLLLLSSSIDSHFHLPFWLLLLLLLSSIDSHFPSYILVINAITYIYRRLCTSVSRFIGPSVDSLVHPSLRRSIRQFVSWSVHPSLFSNGKKGHFLFSDNNKIIHGKRVRLSVCPSVAMSVCPSSDLVRQMTYCT